MTPTDPEKQLRESMAKAESIYLDPPWCGDEDAETAAEEAWEKEIAECEARADARRKGE